MKMMVQYKMWSTANLSLPLPPFPHFHISSKCTSRRGGMKNTSWQTLRGHYRSLYYQHLLSVDVILDDDFLADTNYTASARKRQQTCSSLHGLGKPWTRSYSGTAAPQCPFSLHSYACMQTGPQSSNQMDRSQAFQPHSFQEGLMPFTDIPAVVDCRRRAILRSFAELLSPKTTEDEEGTVWSIFLRSGGWNLTWPSFWNEVQVT